MSATPFEKIVVYIIAVNWKEPPPSVTVIQQANPYNILKWHVLFMGKNYRA
jgi:hypothetical protein